MSDIAAAIADSSVRNFTKKVLLKKPRTIP
jgi:hypothetical protein